LVVISMLGWKQPRHKSYLTGFPVRAFTFPLLPA
jgi:hypothetical protein